jgi:outer membrane protein TolC
LSLARTDRIEATLAESSLLDARIAEAFAYSAVQISAATLAFAMGGIGDTPR